MLLSSYYTTSVFVDLEMAELSSCPTGCEILEKSKTFNFLYKENTWPEKLLMDLNVLRLEGLLCDLTVLVDGIEFRCHRTVLAATCPYFQALFRHDIQARTKAELRLDGVSVIGFQLILDFIYTSKLIIAYETVVDLLEAADFLQYRDIVRICCDILLQHISDENALSLNQLAVAHLCQPLAEATREYILSNIFSVAQTKDFGFLSPEVMRDFMSSFKIYFPNPDGKCSNIRQYLSQWTCQFQQCFLSEISDISADGCYSNHCDNVSPFSGDASSESDVVLSTVEDSLRLFESHLKDIEILVVVPGEASGKNETLTKRNMRNIFYFDPYAERWFILTELPFYNRMFYSVTVLNNVLYICGGEKKYDMPTRKVHAYVISENKWLMQIQSMLKPRSNHSAAASGGVLFVVGGRGSSDNDLWNNGESYDPKTDQWTLLPSVPDIAGLARCSLVPLGGQLYIFGGMESYVSAAQAKERRVFRGAYRYDLGQKQWMPCPALAFQLEEHKISVGLGDCFAWKGFILIIDEDKRGKKMKLFNPVTGSMVNFINSNGQHRFGGYALMNNVLYCTGGMVGYFECHDLVHCTNLLEQADWQFLTPLPCSLSHHFCAVLSKYLEGNSEE